MAHADLLTQPRFEGTVTLPDGRRLSFAEFGVAHGRPIIWLHGTPGARRQIPEAARAAALELGLRLVGIDRPGVGDSTPHFYGKILDFADDLDIVTDRLGIDEFGLIGLSGGGPYVLACCYAMPERVRASVVLGGVAPTVGPDAAPGGVVSLAARFQRVLVPLRVPLGLTVSSLLWIGRPFADPALSLYAKYSPPGDRRVFARPEMRAMFLDDLLNGSKPGLRAPVYDALLFGRDWGFSVRDIPVPIRWWHGDADHIVPLRHGQHVVNLLPHADLFIQPGESHLGSLGEAEAILDTLLEAWDARDRAASAG